MSYMGYASPVLLKCDLIKAHLSLFRFFLAYLSLLGLLCPHLGLF